MSNKDFEVHAIGTSKEVKLSRELANALGTSYFGDNENILRALNALKNHYQWQIENRETIN